jgi:hypothetical protein
VRQGTLSSGKVILVKEFLFSMQYYSMPTEKNDLENDRDQMDPVHSALRLLNYFTLTG